MFSSIEDVVTRFGNHDYIASRRIATVIFLASALQKPVLVEGPAGVGKTDLAKVLAASLKEELIRLGAYRTGSSPEVDEAIGLHPPFEQFLGQGKEESTTLAEGYRRLAEILTVAETEN